MKSKSDTYRAAVTLLDILFNFINGMKSNGRKDKKESIDGEKGLW